MPIVIEGGGNLNIEGGGSLLVEGESVGAIENEWTRALAELIEAQDETTGVERRVTVGALTGLFALIEDVPRDLVYVDGGKAEKQTFRLIINATAFSLVEPAKFTAVSFNPIGSTEPFTGAVLEVTANNGNFYLLVGDPNAMDA
jgi:hypothetical protein